MDLPEIDWWGTLNELGNVVLVILNAIYTGVMWGYNIVEVNVGSGAGFLFIAFIFIILPFLAINKSISSTQAFMESIQAGLATFFIKIVAILLLTFVILFVLSQI